MTDQVKLGSEIIQSVINCISQTNLCSYQIAYKHHISQHSVESIGLKNLGKNIYWNKERLALTNLSYSIRSLKAEGYSNNEIGKQLGVYPSTAHKLISRLRNVPSLPGAKAQAQEPIALEAPVGENDLVQVISLESEPTTEPTVAQAGAVKAPAGATLSKIKQDSQTIEVPPIEEVNPQSELTAQYVAESTPTTEQVTATSAVENDSIVSTESTEVPSALSENNPITSKTDVATYPVVKDDINFRRRMVNVTYRGAQVKFEADGNFEQSIINILKGLTSREVVNK